MSSRTISTWTNLSEGNRRQTKLAIIGVAISWTIAFLMAYSTSGI